MRRTVASTITTRVLTTSSTTWNHMIPRSTNCSSSIGSISDNYYHRRRILRCYSHSTEYGATTNENNEKTTNNNVEYNNNQKFNVLPILPKPSIDNVPQPIISKSTSSENNNYEMKWYNKLYRRYSIKEQQYRIYRAEELFQAASIQASDPIWYGPGYIGRDFRSRHAILTMHIWLLHKRLVADSQGSINEDDALHIQEELFNILWDDTTCRIRAQENVNELSVNKLLLQVQQYTFLHLTHYDHAYTEYLDKPIQRLKELRTIIHQHIYKTSDVITAEQYDLIDRIAWYIDCNYCNIMLHWPYEYYEESRVSWTTIPDFSNMKDYNNVGKLLPNQLIHDDDVVPEPWLKNITLRGIDYYWNPITRESTWDKPTPT